MRHLYELLVAALLVLFVSSVAYSAGATVTKDDEARLVSGIKKLDPAIVEVRPASVSEPSRASFKIQWNPAVKISKSLSIDHQKDIARKVTQFVVSLQGGVPTDGVLGGMIAFFEGDGWTPQIGQVFYKIDEAKAGDVEVWTGLNIVREDGGVSCCGDGELIGRIEGKQFVASQNRIKK